MSEITLTHVDSLDSDTVVVEGIDIDAALACTIAKGKKKLRRRRIIAAVSTASSILLVVAVLSVIAFASGSPTKVRAVDDGETTETTIVTIPETTTETTVPVETSTTLAAQTSIPALVPRKTGSKQLCNSVEGTVNPGPGEVSLTPARQLTDWNPTTQPTFEVTTPYNGVITFYRATRADASERWAADIKQGYPDYAYVSVSNVFLQFCVEGAKVEMEYNSNTSFIVSTIML